MKHKELNCLHNNFLLISKTSIYFPYHFVRLHNSKFTEESKINNRNVYIETKHISPENKELSIVVMKYIRKKSSRQSQFSRRKIQLYEP